MTISKDEGKTRADIIEQQKIYNKADDFINIFDA